MAFTHRIRNSFLKRIIPQTKSNRTNDAPEITFVRVFKLYVYHETSWTGPRERTDTKDVNNFREIRTSRKISRVIISRIIMRQQVKFKLGSVYHVKSLLDRKERNVIVTGEELSDA